MTKLQNLPSVLTESAQRFDWSSSAKGHYYFLCTVNCECCILWKLNLVRYCFVLFLDLFKMFSSCFLFLSDFFPLIFVLCFFPTSIMFIHWVFIVLVDDNICYTKLELWLVLFKHVLCISIYCVCNCKLDTNTCNCIV